jgi:hypothetical protein
VHLGQKVPVVFAYFQVSVAPRLENPDSDDKDALFVPNYFAQPVYCVSQNSRNNSMGQCQLMLKNEKNNKKMQYLLDLKI